MPNSRLPRKPVMAVRGEIMLMPGLPRTPAAETIDIDDAGNVSGLF